MEARIRSIRFPIRYPRGKTVRHFGLTKDTLYLSGKRTQITVEDPLITDLNRKIDSGILTEAGACAELRQRIIPELRKRARIVQEESDEAQVEANNWKAYRAFWEQEYDSKAILQGSKDSMENAIIAALKCLGKGISLNSSSKGDIRTRIYQASLSSQRMHCLAVNQLLRFLKRDFQVEPKRRPSTPEVSFVTWEELQLVLAQIEEGEIKALAGALWGTGVRIGEAFAESFTALAKDQTIYIHKQMDREGATRDTKNGVSHRTLLDPLAGEHYKSWCRVSNKEYWRRHNLASKVIIEASKVAFKDKKSKQVSPHDLRHSYAIHMLGKGLTVSEVANLLGDSEAVVRKYYAGFVMTDAILDGIKRKISASVAK